VKHFQAFLNRIVNGELDDGEEFDQRTGKFAKEVIAATDQGLMTGKQAATLWLHHLKRLGFPVEIPED